MGRKVVAVETKLSAVLAARLDGNSVAEVCRLLGISRQTFYKYKRRFAAEGIEGLRERSRRPARSPRLISAELEDEIVRLRKELPLDNGAAHIRFHLIRAGIDPPSVSTIHRALRRRGLVVDQPAKRPKASFIRFEWPRANDLWQIDATCWVLRGGKEAWILDSVDDHSRLLGAARAHHGPTGDAAWDCFTHAADRLGLPARVLSDGGSCFTGKRRPNTIVAFERRLADLGIKHIVASPHHPETCGKLERFHSTEKRWLAKQPRARDLRELQDQLDEFLPFYNNQRPHSAIGGATPAERYAAAERATPQGVEADEAVEVRELSVDSGGKLVWPPFVINVGVMWHGTTLTALRRGQEMWVFSADQLVRRLTLDAGRRYQPSGQIRGGPRQLRANGKA